MGFGYMGAIEKFDQVILHSNSKNPDLAALAEGMKLLAQAIRNDLQKIDREVGSAKAEIHSTHNDVRAVKTRI